MFSSTLTTNKNSNDESFTTISTFTTTTPPVEAVATTTTTTATTTAATPIVSTLPTTTSANITLNPLVGDGRIPIDYFNKLILAPMVRIGTLPTRLQALRYGADLVYGEEIIDFKMLQTKRLFNTQLGCIDFVEPDGSVLFRTCAEERNRVVFQVGTSDPERAVAVAKMLVNDVVAIDVNMGCPKPFSVQGGMGAALLKSPDKIKAILTALVGAVGHKLHVTCKIRVLPTVEETVELVKMIRDTGVSAIAIHSRLTHERPREPGHPEYIAQVARALRESFESSMSSESIAEPSSSSSSSSARKPFPIIANGGSLTISQYSDIEEFKNKTGCDSVMLARAAQWDLSVFRREGPLPRLQVVQDYLKCALEWGDSFANVRFCANHLLTNSKLQLAQPFNTCSTIEELCAVADISPLEIAQVQQAKEARVAAVCKEMFSNLSVTNDDSNGNSNSNSNSNGNGNGNDNGNAFESVMGPVQLKRKYSNEFGEFVVSQAEKEAKRIREDGLENNGTLSASPTDAAANANTVVLPLKFFTKVMSKLSAEYPRAVLQGYLKKLNKEAKTTIEENNSLFRAVLEVDGKRYWSSVWERRKKDAEHASAIVYLLEHSPESVPPTCYSIENSHYQFIEGGEKEKKAMVL